MGQVGYYIAKGINPAQSTPENKVYGYHARAYRYSTIDVNDLAEHISMDSQVERSKVQVITDSLIKQIEEMVLNGHRIVLPHLGAFKPMVRSKEAINSAYFDANQIKVRVHFQASTEIKNELKSIRFSKVDVPDTEVEDENVTGYVRFVGPDGQVFKARCIHMKGDTTLKIVSFADHNTYSVYGPEKKFTNGDTTYSIPSAILINQQTLDNYILESDGKFELIDGEGDEALVFMEKYPPVDKMLDKTRIELDGVYLNYLGFKVQNEIAYLTQWGLIPPQEAGGRYRYAYRLIGDGREDVLLAGDYARIDAIPETENVNEVLQQFASLAIPENNHANYPVEDMDTPAFYSGIDMSDMWMSENVYSPNVAPEP